MTAAGTLNVELFEIEHGHTKKAKHDACHGGDTSEIATPLRNIEQHYPQSRRRSHYCDKTAADIALGKHDDALVDKQKNDAAHGRLKDKSTAQQPLATQPAYSKQGQTCHGEAHRAEHERRKVVKTNPDEIICRAPYNVYEEIGCSYRKAAGWLWHRQFVW